MDDQGDTDDTAPVPISPAPAATVLKETVALRPDTAVSPIIQAESVGIPTPVWGALAAEDLARLRAAAAGGAGGALDAEQEAEAGRAFRRRNPIPGWVSILLFVITAVLHAAAVSTAGYVDLGGGTVLAWAAIVVSILGFLLGVFAAVWRFGRWLGVIGAFGCALANPWVVLVVLRLFGA